MTADARILLRLRNCSQKELVSSEPARIGHDAGGKKLDN